MSQVSSELNCGKHLETTYVLPDIVQLSKQLPTVEFLDIDLEPSRFLEIRHYHANVLLDLRCASAQGFLDLTSSQRLFNASRSFIAYGRDLNEVREMLHAQDINVNSKLMVVDDKEEMYEVKCSELRRGMPLHVTQIGAFRRGRLELNATKIDFNLHGTTVFVVVNVCEGRKVN